MSRPRSATEGWYVVSGGDGDACPHPEGERDYLGNAGVTRFYRCGGCDSVLIRRPDDPDPDRPPA